VALAVAGSAVVVTRAPASRPADGLERVRAARGDVGPVVKATGVVKPMVGAEVRVGSRASGVVSRLHVRVGDEVAAGQLLAEIDFREFAARRDEKRAALASATANLSFARADLGRKRRLAEELLLSPSDLELAERSCAVAETAEAEARAALASTQAQLDYASIRAPIAGVVANVATQEGETVAASLAAPTFVTLLDLSRLELWAYVDETDIGRVLAGQDVRFSVDTYPGVDFAGRVSTIYPKAEIRDNVVDYVAVVRFTVPKDKVLRPEMTATVRIAIDTRIGVLTLPRRAVRRDGGRSYVLVPGSGADAPIRRFITTGVSDDAVWEVRDGLKEGDEVLLGEPAEKEGDAR
jgi:macrolide-specific efflux system membrane fusion protein